MTMPKDVNRIVALNLGVIEGVPDMFCLDPGTTSGWCYYAPANGLVECGQLGPKSHQLELLTLIESKLALSIDNHLELLFERFEFRHFEEALRRRLRAFLNDELRPRKIRSLQTIIDSLAQIAESVHTKDNLVLDSREYIGIAKLATQIQRASGHIQLASQMPADMSFCTNGTLNALGWLEHTQGLPHARDALRHLVKRLVSRYGVKHPITTACFNAMKASKGA